MTRHSPADAQLASLTGGPAAGRRQLATARRTLRTPAPPLEVR
jgi:hypothetical protein